jgi:four helix bundle protein
MSTIKSHRDLEAWNVAMDLTTETYRLTDVFPDRERYGLQSQMRRAAVSVPSNIAEGQARQAGAAVNHLSISLGSLAELDTQLEVAIRLRYLPEAGVREFRQLMESTGRLVSGLRRAKRTQLAGTVAKSAGVLLIVFYALQQVLGS